MVYFMYFFFVLEVLMHANLTLFRKNYNENLNLINILSFINRNYDSELYAFCKRLNEEFNDQLLREALIDESYVFEEKKRQIKVGIDEPQFDLKSNKELNASGRSLIEDFSMKYLRGIFPLLPEEGVE